MKVHFKSGKYNCSKCDHNFHNKNEWQRHEASHSDDRWFMCGRCDRSFKSAPNLSDHMRNCQVGKRPEELVMMKCSHYTKEFSSQALLHVHLRDILQGPYECKMCEKKYTKFSSFWHHKRTHMSKQDE